MTDSLRLLDGPLEGHEIKVPQPCASVVIPEYESCGGRCVSPHFISHHYSYGGRWLHSETYVGYESDETIATREAFWESERWKYEDSFS